MQTTLNILGDDADAIEIASVTNKALTSNVATLTTAAVHGLSTGDRVVVAGVDSTFDGTYAVASTPLTTTFTYAKTHANVTSAADTGTVSRVQEYSTLTINGRRGQKVILRNLGTGDISYDFSEPDEGANVEDTGFLLAANAQEILEFEGTLYLSSDADDTDLRYAAI